MSKVQSTFTYTIGAQKTEKCAPPAPIRCGCDKLVLILKDRSLVQEVLRGIILATIISVEVSETPVSFIEPSGNTTYVWRYDYVLEYDTDDLTDPTFRIRKCDIESNCCHGCAQIYTDRKLEGTVQIADGYVEAVLGTAVNNADPYNPIINNASASRIPGTNNILFTGNSGSTLTFAEGIAAVSAALPCKGIAAGQSISRFEMVGNTLFIETAALPSVVSGGAVGALNPLGAGVDITALGDYDLADITLLITNPSTCYNLKGMFQIEASAFFDPLEDSVDLQLGVSFTQDPDPAAYSVVDTYENGGASATRALTLQTSFSMNMDEINGVDLAPGASTTVRLRVRVTNSGGGAPSTFMTNLFGAIRFFGVAG